VWLDRFRWNSSRIFCTNYSAFLQTTAPFFAANESLITYARVSLELGTVSDTEEHRGETFVNEASEKREIPNSEIKCRDEIIWKYKIDGLHVWVHRHVNMNTCIHHQNTIHSGPSSYNRLYIRTTWVTAKILVLTYDQILSYDLPASQGHLSYDPHGVRKLQSEPRYACLWT
jgi:hypothetical protein